MKQIYLYFSARSSELRFRASSRGPFKGSFRGSFLRGSFEGSLLWGTLAQNIIVIRNMETLGSTLF